MFKAYDVRGRVPEELNEEIAYRIGAAYAEVIKPEKVVVGMDVRDSSEMLSAALAKGLTDMGVDVYDIGLCGTEEVYFSTFHYKLDGGIMVTASHNPLGYNGMKFVREQSKPISGDSGLNDIRDLVLGDIVFNPTPNKGKIEKLSHRDEYIKHLLGYVDTASLTKLKIAADPGNGCAGVVMEEIEKFLPFEFVHVHYQPDGTFPNGIPNPLLEENRASTAEAVKSSGADLGIAWDGDFDRCFFFDENGEFIEGYYLVAMLAEEMLKSDKGAKIVHDPRLMWNTVDVVNAAGGEPVMSKTGHAFIKERMRLENAVYGGEMSAHHYFRDFAYCDSGMIPWLLVVSLLSKKGCSLSSLVEGYIAKFPCSGEINSTVDDAKAKINMIEEKYKDAAVDVDYTDGLSMAFENWRFNLRMSNTEPLLRLNVESKGDIALMEEKRDELLKLIRNN
ncbi:Phosphomannomutase [Denitrovibrio acetiphilus DSM 12809]|uniref:Phosphomannomutase n=1 Tax=Denitrovibrio acetiphilus (strain DSM 12809 / NBRC 114555 / N2460) TaxID=522772 RepID=D4H578_DENA2|nr:phosphomannomutase/phosphoglucomutase [Denitrovibrio acetiphilus]ADD69434.1 Phosphomannomutase [Denitrovibrio acetiphilus DSM 12809]